MAHGTEFFSINSIYALETDDRKEEKRELEGSSEINRDPRKLGQKSGGNGRNSDDRLEGRTLFPRWGMIITWQKWKQEIIYSNIFKKTVSLN